MSASAYRTDKFFDSRYDFRMGTPVPQRVVFTDRADDGVIVTFANGQSAFYSAALLYEFFSRAVDITFLLDPND